MVKLYYSPGTCSMSCHIALEEANVPYSLILPNWDQPDENLKEMYRLNPLEVTPVLVTQENKTLTQNIGVIEYIDSLQPSARILPAPGTWERAEAFSWLSFVGADLHRAFTPLFGLQAISSTEAGRLEVKQWSIQTLQKYFKHLDNHLANKEYLLGNQFCAADAYCFVVMNWSKVVQVPTDGFPHLQAYVTRIYQRPTVQKVLKMEGLLR